MFGGGGMNPRKMKQMMKQMGIDVTELDVEEVRIQTAEEDLVFDDAQVTRMDAQGQQTYQIVGEPETREHSDTQQAVSGDTGGDSSGDSDTGDIPDADIEIVAERAGVNTDDARAALESTDGDLAAAIAQLE
ncbi:nascent polypeptide-associated complex protein [Haloquadratum walsbyi]|jgi:nascent polypeptide-associated complex subunit alpha|uniref:Nascent polypeptide-associated complex protein n=2 Tax=Haloquadratum walsbyi TaxID=293091 RepID=Q18HL9_HALWD|nr:nascent polypeptide-associated complex protein [Haloquadratum walsbyi]CAJ52519.2 nascent polypeptide-associated complex protein [Haloquadratum walsbyi DSM 16790]CCC40493.1 nascent polypeptide-associated complex protein [Haloquadratum walsbyi C23]